MGSPERPAPDRLAAARTALELLGPAARHGFVVLVSLLERLEPDAVRVGGPGPPAAEALRFRHDPSLTFHTRDVASVVLGAPPTDPFAAAEARALYEVTTTFLGLSGTVSPLPLHMSEEILGEDEDHPAKRDFLDVFHHRLLSLLYRLLVKYDFAREFLAGGKDDWSRRVLALAGMPEEATGSHLPRWRLLRLAPLLATRARNAHGLELALMDVLGDELEGARVSIEEFVGAWVQLEPTQQAQLGRANSTLGRDLLLGQRVFDRGGKFRLSVAPLTNRAFERLRPEGDLFPIVREVVGLMNPDPLAYDLELVLAMAETPPYQLSAASQSRLGQNTWLGGRREADARMSFTIDG
jgi:type VI secretion system protein ImpH